MTGSWKRKCRIGAGQVGGHLVEMPDVGWATAPGLALVLQLQVGGEQVQEGLKQRPDRVKDYAMVCDDEDKGIKPNGKITNDNLVFRPAHHFHCIKI